MLNYKKSESKSREPHENELKPRKIKFKQNWF